MENNTNQNTNSIVSTLWSRYGSYFVTIFLLLIISFVIEYKLQLAKSLPDQIRSIIFTLVGLTLFIAGLLFSLIKLELIVSGWIVDNFNFIRISVKIIVIVISIITGISLAEKFSVETSLGISFGFWVGVSGAMFVVISLGYKLLKQFNLFRIPYQSSHSNDSYKKFDKWIESKNGLVSLFLEKFDELDIVSLNKKFIDDDLWHTGLAKGLTFMSDERWKLLIDMLDEDSVRHLINNNLLRSYLIENPLVAIMLYQKQKELLSNFNQQNDYLAHLLVDENIDLSKISDITSPKLKKIIGEKVFSMLQ